VYVDQVRSPKNLASGVLVLALVARWRHARADTIAPDVEREALARALDAPIGAAVEKAGAALDPPPLPPRKRGVSIEGSVGALGFVSDLGHVSPMASRFRLQLGYDVFRWLMVCGTGELAFTSTRYAPPARAYGMAALGTGLRATVPLGARLGAYLQGEAGVVKTTSNALHGYGYFDAERFGPYFGAMAGLEWYAVDPHYALSAAGGARRAPGFSRNGGDDAGLSWLASASLRYTF
jgi:hypothetical protein